MRVQSLKNNNNINQENMYDQEHKKWKLSKYFHVLKWNMATLSAGVSTNLSILFFCQAVHCRNYLPR